MTKDEIIKLAREAGIDPTQDTLCRNGGWEEPIEAFARACYEAGRTAERSAMLDLVDSYAKNNTDLRDAIRARGEP